MRWNWLAIFAALWCTGGAGRAADPVMAADARAAAATNQAIERFVSQSAPRYVGHTEGRIMPGNQRTLGDVNLFVPLWQGHHEMFYADVRGQMDDGSNYEGNWGLGYRALLDSDMVVGGYAYYDSRWSEHGNHFNQMTLGIEAMTVDWDFRMNGYLPDTNVKSVDGTGGAQAQLIGNQLFIVTQGESSEMAYYGGDFEVGRLLRAWGPNNQIELRGFAGAYHFDSDEDVPDITGPRARLELRAFDLKRLGHGSRLTLGADYQWDQVRNDQYFASATVRIPFGPGSRQLNPLERRMVDRVVRDVDIVTNTQQGEVGEAEEALFADTESLVAGVHVINSTDDASDIAQDAPNDSLLVLNGTNTGTSTSVFMNEGQRLVGGGTQVALKGATSGTLVNYQAPGTAGTLSMDIRTADRVTIDNITLDQHQLSVLFSDQVHVRNTTIEGAHIFVMDSSALLEGVNIRNSGNVLYTDAAQVTVRDSNFTNTAGGLAGRLVTGSIAGTQSVLIENSTFTTSGNVAISVTVAPSATSNVTLRNNTISSADTMIQATGGTANAVNLSMSGNVALSGGGFDLTSGSSYFAVEQADMATLSALNGGGGWSMLGTIHFNEAAPALPTWP